MTRREFHPLLLSHMRADPRIWLITPDLGFKMWDAIAAEFPDRFVNCGAAEQLAHGIAVGLAEEGKIPVLYSITPFLLWRGAEWIRNYADHEKVAVKFLGGGRGKDYAHDGFTHDASDDHAFFSLFKNIECFWPNEVGEPAEELDPIVKAWLYNGGPSYMNLSR